MIITIRGVRGSIPTSGPDTEVYGGNTSCTDIIAEGWQLLLDAGSGIRNARKREKLFNNRVDILLSHLHLDHIQGLGFFQPLFDPTMEVHIWGPVSTSQSLHSRLSTYLSPPLFPVHLRELPCKLNLHEIHNSKFQIGPFLIQSKYVIHPGPTVGYRIIENNLVFSYIPDHEPALGLHGIPKDLKWVSGIDLAADADLLLHDAQYSKFEYNERIGWGHSSMDDALYFASISGVKRLLMSHHDPVHSDQQLEKLFSELKQTNHYSFPYELAKEGVQFEL